MGTENKKNKRNLYYIDVDLKKRNTAGMKAPKDISNLCEQYGMNRFSMPRYPSEKNNVYQKIWLFFVCPYYWIKLLKTVNSGDIVLYQHPMYGNRVSAFFIPLIQKRKNCKFIAVIHDLESLRKGIDGVIAHNQKTSEISDNILLKEFDVVICHNNHMKDYLIKQGFDADKLVCLGIFDYLCNCERREVPKGKNPSICIAGNLAPGKCAYIYDILNKKNQANSDLTIHLYGENFDEKMADKHMVYHGSFKPAELPSHLMGDFGLVWDGISVETCAGNTGEYLKYNNPHKTSLYLASGLPVIVWKQAAIADFVLEHHVGITVDSLNSIGEIITNISENDYKTMRDNANNVGEKIRHGGYFVNALHKSLEIIGYIDN